MAKPDLSIKPDEIDWRIGSTYEKDNQRWGMLLGYIDARLAMEKLDTLDPSWSTRMEPVSLNGDSGVRCSLTVNGVTREDVGTASSTDPLKGAFSDALKRAAVHHGVGRELYELPSIGVKVEVRKNGKTGRPLTLPEWKNGRWTVNHDLGWVRYDHEPKPTAPVVEQETTVRYEGAAQTSGTVPIEQAGYTEQTLQQIVEQTGGTEVVVGPSAVENVERGGRTQNANEAQISEVKRLATDLGWQSKQILGYVYAIFEAEEPEIPADGRVARGVLTDYLDGMDSEEIGKLITSMQSDLDLKEQAKDSAVDA